jgi:hypothetical protein
MKVELERLLARPTIGEVELLGSIEFDSGFAKVQYIPLVDMSRSRLRVLARSVTRPKATMYELTRQYAWTRGLIRYYNLWHTLLLLKGVGFLRGRRYI